MVNKDLIRGTLKPIILSVLGEGARLYGYEINKMVAEKTGNEIKLTDGALYPMLHRLEKDGLLEVEKEEVGSRIRKYYKLTANGERESSKQVDELLNFMRSIVILLKPQAQNI